MAGQKRDDEMKNLAPKRGKYFPPDHVIIHICSTDWKKQHSCSSS